MISWWGARSRSCPLDGPLGTHRPTGFFRAKSTFVRTGRTNVLFAPNMRVGSGQEEADGELEAVRDVGRGGAAGHPGDQVGQPHVADHPGDGLLLVRRRVVRHRPGEHRLHQQRDPIDLRAGRGVGEGERARHRLGEVRVALQAAGDPAEHEQHAFVGAVAGNGRAVHLLLRALQLDREARHQQVDLRREVAVERAQCDVGAVGHGPHLHGVEPALGGQRDGRVDDPLAPLALGGRAELVARHERVRTRLRRWHGDDPPGTCCTGPLIVPDRFPRHDLLPELEHVL